MNVLWTPHPRQIKALESPEFEILYGGSRGGGKTAAGIAWLLEYADNPNFRGLVLRRNSEDLKDWVDRAAQLYSQLSNKGTQKGNPPEFHFDSGAIIRTGHLKDAQAYTKYQGHEYHKILIEELTHIAEEKHYLKILSSARSVTPGLRSQIFLTTNPGGAGHMWVKKRFVDPMPPEQTIWNDDGRTRVFIPATMDDNPTLMENDPMYVKNIESLRDVDPETYRAWRFGDWDVFAGQVFREFRRQTHVIKPITPKKAFTHYLCMDWGYSESSAFVAYLFAVAKMTTQDGDKYNQIVFYKEWYGNQKDPDEWARIIYKDCKEMGIRPEYNFTDPAMHNTQTDGSQSISDLMEAEWKRLYGGNWIRSKRGTNNRVQGVATVHKWLGSSPTGVPYCVFTENCTNMIRTLPMLVYDQNKIEDVDTTQEDHAFDALKYGLSQVKFIGVSSGADARGGVKRLRRYNRKGEQISINLDKFKETPKTKKEYFT